MSTGEKKGVEARVYYPNKTNTVHFLKIKKLLGNGTHLKEYVKLNSFTLQGYDQETSKQGETPQFAITGLGVGFTALTNVGRLLQALHKGNADGELGEVEVLEVDSDRKDYKTLKKFLLKEGDDQDKMKHKPHIKSLLISLYEDGTFNVDMQIAAPITVATVNKEDGSKDWEKTHNIPFDTVA